MRILFQSRIDLFTRCGGDTIQMEKTAEGLRRLGVEIDIDCSANHDLSDYDLVHLFNIDWPAQTYLQAKNAKNQGKPIVFSPIHHSFREIERYEKEARYGLRRIINAVFRKRENRERFKDLCRMLADSKKISSTLVEFNTGILNEQKELLEMADVVLVQTGAEAEDIKTDFDFDCHSGGGPVLRRTDDRISETLSPFGLQSDNRVLKVVNGVEPRFAEAKPDWFVEKYDLREFILCVGRIEPRKNQLAVIEAVSRFRHSGAPPRGLGAGAIESRSGERLYRADPIRQLADGGPGPQSDNVSLVFVGKISWRHPEYALRFKHLVQKYDWAYHIPQIPYEKMGSCYAAAKVHVLASWFETTGLVSLEAGLAGCSVVATGERVREYLGDFAEYCDPGDTNSIAAAIRRVWEKSPDPAFKKHVLENFTWDKAAEQTLAAYTRVLGRKG